MSNISMVGPSTNLFIRFEIKSDVQWFYYQEKDIYNILVPKLQKLKGASAMTYVNLKRISLISPSVQQYVDQLASNVYNYLVFL